MNTKFCKIINQAKDKVRIKSRVLLILKKISKEFRKDTMCLRAGIGSFRRLLKELKNSLDLLKLEINSQEGFTHQIWTDLKITCKRIE